MAKHSIIMRCREENNRLIADDFEWPEWDQQWCIHGEKLRWTCDWCEEYFKRRNESGQQEKQEERKSYGK